MHLKADKLSYDERIGRMKVFIRRGRMKGNRKRSYKRLEEI
jgi:hypothetical protein